MSLKKMTAVGVLALVLGCANSIQAVLVAVDGERRKTRSESEEEGLLREPLPERGLENGEGPAEPLILRPRPSFGTTSPYKPPVKPQPSPRPKAPVKVPTKPSADNNNGSGVPKPTPPGTRPS
jgi:hypothetical protein